MEYMALEVQALSQRTPTSMMPLSAFIQPAQARKKLLKYQKHEVWRRKNREIINEKIRLARRKRRRL